MVNKFYKKLQNNEYISKALYEEVKNSIKNNIKIYFDLDKYNDEILEISYRKYKEYFSNMYKGIDNNIKLDKDQIKAILADEDYALIIAGAGTGKTTTVASLVKYLVDIKNVEPSKIAVISYTKKAVKELEKRIYYDFNIPAEITTFHSLGMMYIREIFNNKKCLIIDENDKNDIFLKYFKNHIFKNKEKVREIIDIFGTGINYRKIKFGNYFKENYDKYDNYEEFFDNYKKHKKSEISDIKLEVKRRIDKLLNNDDVILTINNEIVKSKGEALIANFLFCNNINYKYEKVYKDLVEDRRTYKPDFTLYLGGDEIYLEYFGLSEYNDDELKKYNKIRKMKEDYHKKHHTRFISLGWNSNKDLLSELKESLLKMGFKLQPKSYDEIFDRLLDNNQISQIYEYKDFLYNNIKWIKSSINRKTYLNIINNYLSFETNITEQQTMKKQFNYINDFYLFYQNKLYGEQNYIFDFEDMIYYANLYMEKNINKKNFKYEYLIIDEYQDISQEKYEFSKKIVNLNNAKVIAVGDDWQSIYAFNGSNIDYIYNFENYFKNAKIFRINNTYRNGQTLTNYAGSFIMKNPKQIKKELTAKKDIINPIKLVMFSDGDEYDVLKKLIIKINKIHPNEKILILSRTNANIKQIFNDSDFIDSIENKIEILGYKDIDLEAMTIHKSKGLTSDEVILIGLNENFPSKDLSLFWLERLFRPQKEEEPIEYAEERRILYVALTRAKNNVYMLVNRNSNHQSKFIHEICKIITSTEYNK